MTQTNYYVPMYYDEDVRSILFRIQKLYSKPYMQINEELFGKSARYPAMLPVNLLRLVEHFSLDHTQFLQEHTYIPVLFPYYDEEMKTKVISSLTGGQRNVVMHLRMLSKEIYYCPSCLDEDYNQIGECYIHRIHQFKDIRICELHSEILIKNCPFCDIDLTNNGTVPLLTPNCKNCGYKFVRSKLDVDNNTVMHSLIKNLRYFLDHGVNLTRNFLAHKLKVYAFKNGYVRQNGSFDCSKIEADIFKVLAGLKYQRIEKIKISDYMGATRSEMLLLNLIIIYLLTGDIYNLVQNVEPIVASEIPCGNGPWICRNKYCDGYEKQVITYCKRRYENKLKAVIVILQCPKCEFIYSLNSVTKKYAVLYQGPIWKAKSLDQQDLAPRKRAYYRRTSRQYEVREKYNSRTFDWFKSVITVYEENGLLSETARIFNITTATVKKYLDAYNNSNKDISIFLDHPRCLDGKEIKLIQIKNTVSQLLSEPEMTRGKIRENIGDGNYNFLYKNDKTWLDDHFPNKKRYEVIDFIESDFRISAKIRSTCESIWSSPPARRIKMKTLLQDLSTTEKIRLAKFKENFPLSYEEIKKNVESIEKYQIRVIPRRIQQMQNEGYKHITLEKVIKVHHATFHNCTDFVKQSILNSIESICNQKSQKDADE